ncbi:MAG: hypothetical protein B7Z75_11050 [Acidocella sp. 20-57-95]|nr:MAG: hypothetical protein B7Z75_11050 [Acidocella sp. 20-57-95]OYV58900.1 MAG: hypothetical protein B7Z71_09215 [Acidocella sp. 21-58-7]HQT63391.1 hypothetical protein [Acidocella sp.]HQU04043.1 hypothetical protein [Acidocella sp.]
MTESETEEQTLERLEAALRRIADLAGAPKMTSHPDIDRKALVKTLDTLIERLRTGLQAPNSSQYNLE